MNVFTSNCCTDAAEPKTGQTFKAAYRGCNQEEEPQHGGSRHSGLLRKQMDRRTQLMGVTSGSETHHDLRLNLNLHLRTICNTTEETTTSEESALLTFTTVVVKVKDHLRLAQSIIFTLSNAGGSCLFS